MITIKIFSIKFFDVNGVVYATGYLDNIKLKKTNTFIQNLETGEKHIFQDDVSIFSLVGFSKKGKNPILYGQHGQGLK